MVGNIVVDGLLASCYASTQHDYGHNAMAPMLHFPVIMDLIFGKDIRGPVYVTIIEEITKQVLSSILKDI